MNRTRILLVAQNVLAVASIFLMFCPLSSRPHSFDGITLRSLSVFDLWTVNKYNLGVFYLWGLMIILTSSLHFFGISRKFSPLLLGRLATITGFLVLMLSWASWGRIDDCNSAIYAYLLRFNGFPPTRTVWVHFSSWYYALLAIAAMQLIMGFSLTMSSEANELERALKERRKQKRQSMS